MRGHEPQAVANRAAGLLAGFSLRRSVAVIRDRLSERSRVRGSTAKTPPVGWRFGVHAGGRHTDARFLARRTRSVPKARSAGLVPLFRDREPAARGSILQPLGGRGTGGEARRRGHMLSWPRAPPLGASRERERGAAAPANSPRWWAAPFLGRSGGVHARPLGWALGRQADAAARQRPERSEYLKGWPAGFLIAMAGQLSSAFDDIRGVKRAAYLRPDPAPGAHGRVGSVFLRPRPPLVGGTARPSFFGVGVPPGTTINQSPCKADCEGRQTVRRPPRVRMAAFGLNWRSSSPSSWMRAWRGVLSWGWRAPWHDNQPVTMQAARASDQRAEPPPCGIQIPHETECCAKINIVGGTGIPHGGFQAVVNQPHHNSKRSGNERENELGRSQAGPAKDDRERRRHSPHEPAQQNTSSLQAPTAILPSSTGSLYRKDDQGPGKVGDTQNSRGARRCKGSSGTAHQPQPYLPIHTVCPIAPTNGRSKTFSPSTSPRRSPNRTDRPSQGWSTKHEQRKKKDLTCLVRKSRKPSIQQAL